MPTPRQVFLQETEDEDNQRLVFAALLGILSEDTKLIELAACIGMEATLNVMLMFGGSRISIPKAGVIADAMNAAGAVAEVHRGALTKKEARSKYGVSGAVLDQGLKMVGIHQEEMADLRQKLRKRTYDKGRPPRR